MSIYVCILYIYIYSHPQGDLFRSIRSLQCGSLSLSRSLSLSLSLCMCVCVKMFVNLACLDTLKSSD